ncbi:hypothetical protein ACFU76_23185 [Streptomyces sp. NPDC057539]|uniref:hypothetical protein n=1 Tax=Streptomyces sp. NPDC057539 TaxID=3346159 RepID=UPI00368DC60A
MPEHRNRFGHPTVTSQRRLFTPTETTRPGGILVACAITIALLGKYTYPAVEGFDQVAAKDEFAASELLSEIAEGEGEPARDARPAAIVGEQKSSLS